MNIMIHVISLLSRYLYILVAVAILVVMPYSVHLAYNAYKDFHAAQSRLTLAKQVREAEDQHLEKIKAYQLFSTEVKSFLKSAQENRVDESGWTTYDVSIKNRLSTVMDLRILLTNAAPTSRYYFKPKRLEITSLFAKESLPEEYQALLYGKDKGSGGVEKILGLDEKPPVPGEKVLLSLYGTYLVFPRS